MSDKTLVCGVFADAYIVMLEQDKARELEQVWRALDTAKTWGEARDIMPKDYFNVLWHNLSEDSEDEDKPLPAMSDAFDREAVSGHADGDWPDWPAADMLDWVPEDIQGRYGQQASTRLNGDFLEIAPEHLEAVMSELSALGYLCVRDDELIARISGQGQW